MRALVFVIALLIGAHTADASTFFKFYEHSASLEDAEVVRDIQMMSRWYRCTEAMAVTSFSATVVVEVKKVKKKKKKKKKSTLVPVTREIAGAVLTCGKPTPEELRLYKEVYFSLRKIAMESGATVPMYETENLEPLPNPPRPPRADLPKQTETTKKK